MVAFQFVMEMSLGSASPYEHESGPRPFSPFSNSSSSLKLRGTFDMAAVDWCQDGAHDSHAHLITSRRGRAFFWSVPSSLATIVVPLSCLRQLLPCWCTDVPSFFHVILLYPCATALPHFPCFPFFPFCRRPPAPPLRLMRGVARSRQPVAPARGRPRQAQNGPATVSRKSRCRKWGPARWSARPITYASGQLMTFLRVQVAIRSLPGARMGEARRHQEPLYNHSFLFLQPGRPSDVLFYYVVLR